jgi:hypothetical protein
MLPKAPLSADLPPTFHPPSPSELTTKFWLLAQQQQRVFAGLLTPAEQLSLAQL